MSDVTIFNVIPSIFLKQERENRRVGVEGSRGMLLVLLIVYNDIDNVVDQKRGALKYHLSSQLYLTQLTMIFLLVFLEIILF